jgi:hypothetical protein
MTQLLWLLRNITTLCRFVSCYFVHCTLSGNLNLFCIFRLNLFQNCKLKFAIITWCRSVPYRIYCRSWILRIDIDRSCNANAFCSVWIFTGYTVFQLFSDTVDFKELCYLFEGYTTLHKVYLACDIK